MTIVDTAAPDVEQAEAFVGRLFEGALGTVDVLTIYIGDRLGLYSALRDAGPMSPTELAQRSSINERYAREWLEQQAVAGIAAPGDEMERLFYGFSVLCCLPAGMSEQPSAGTGTVMRTETMRSYAVAAGFSNVEVLDIPHDLLRFYRLTP